VVAHGEVWWVRLGDGTRRPYLVLTRQAAIPLLHSVLAAPTTRTIRSIPSEVPLDREDGMPHACAVNLDNVTLMPKDYFLKPICALGPQKLREVCRALAETVDCRVLA
jgi:mRNA interferase MazF